MRYKRSANANKIIIERLKLNNNSDNNRFFFKISIESESLPLQLENDIQGGSNDYR